MKSSNKLLPRLFLVFLASFTITFTSSSISLADLMQVELDWTNLPKGVGLVSERVFDRTSLAGQKLGLEINKAGRSYLDFLANFSDGIAFADTPQRTEIFDASKKDYQDLVLEEHVKNIKALTAREIAANKSSDFLMMHEAANIKNFVYYSQHDPRWKDHLIGGRDPIDTFGCGPTALSMLISNTSKAGFTPDKAADWALENGYYMKGSGSFHNIILKGSHAFSIDTRPYGNYSQAAIKSELEKGNIFVALTKPGVFSRASNHFVLIIGLDQNGQAILAEPNSSERTQKTWDLDFLRKQLQYSAGSGGPLWLVKLAS